MMIFLPREYEKSHIYTVIYIILVIYVAHMVLPLLI